jgi:peptidyl-prolyl cis-trans isomerase C
MRTRLFVFASIILAIALGAQAEQPAPATTAAKATPARPAGTRAGQPGLKALPVKAAAPKPGAEAAEAAPAPLTPADVQRRSQALATFKGGQLTVGDLEDAIERQSPLMRSRYNDPKSLKDLYDKTLRFELLAVEAEHRGYANNPSVDQAVKQNAVQALMKADFDDKANADAISKEAVAQYYQDHIGEYVQPAMQRASHILVATEAEAKALLPEAKKADLRAFRQLARDKSIDDATKLRGGDLRYFDQTGKPRDEPDAVVPAPLVKAAFALKNVGDTSPQPIKLPGGYSIVKLTGQRPAISRKVDEVAETIRARLWREQRQKGIEDFVAKLREQAKPEIHAELMDAIKLDDTAGPGPGAGPASMMPKLPMPAK